MRLLAIWLLLTAQMSKKAMPELFLESYALSVLGDFPRVAKRFWPLLPPSLDVVGLPGREDAVPGRGTSGSIEVPPEELARRV